MGSSFQDQLLKLGLVNKQQVEKAKKGKHAERKQKAGKKAAKVDENALLAEQALAKKKERARQLNLEREEKLKKREEAARIRQMIETHRLPKDDGGVAYRFVDKKKVFRVFIAQGVVDKLSGGRAGIVRLDEQYEVCPAEIIRKIKEIDETVVVVFNESANADGGTDDDPYAGYEVPDDLVW